MLSVSEFVAGWEKTVGVKLPFAPPSGARVSGNFVLALPDGVRPMISQGDCHRFFDLPRGSFQLGVWNGTWYLLHVTERERVYLRAGYGGMYSHTEDHRARMQKVFEAYLRLHARADVARLAVMDSMGVADSRVWFRDGSMHQSALLVGWWNERVWAQQPMPGTVVLDPRDAALVAHAIDARTEVAALERRMNALQPDSGRLRSVTDASWADESEVPRFLEAQAHAVRGTELEWAFRLRDRRVAKGRIVFRDAEWVRKNSFALPGHGAHSWALAVTARSRCWTPARGRRVFVDDLESGARVAVFDSLPAFFAAMVSRFGIEGGSAARRRRSFRPMSCGSRCRCDPRCQPSHPSCQTKQSSCIEGVMIETRYGRVQPSVAPLRSVEGTRVGRATALQPRPVAELFVEKQRMMASAVAEEARPGLFIFAAHARFGHVARLWLQAGDAPRAGMIGRHDEVDLPLPLDEALSLRHLMFVVRREQHSVRFVAIDLETPNGVALESGQQVRLVEAVGPLIFVVSEFVFFCVPTGQPLPWNSEAKNPWATLLPRSACRVESLDVTAPGALEGQVEVRSRLGRKSFRLDLSSLRRGVLVGRDPRCEVYVPLDSVSRVHAVLLSLDSELFVIDAGSTNGVWRGDDEVKIARVADGEPFSLGSEVRFHWQAAH